MKDIVLCILPYSNLDHINSAPAILKGVLQDNGFSATSQDFGCLLLKLCDNNTDLFYKVQNYFITSTPAQPEDKLIIDRFYSSIINFFKENPSRIIGISVFSYYTHKATLELILKIKQEGIPSKILIGGRGVNVPFFKETINDQFVPALSSLERTLTFAELFKKRNLVDHVIIGDGEDAILDIMTHSQVLDDYNNHTSEMFKTPIPDYSDYNFDDYLFPDKEINLPVTGSKGCVRDCDFCDVKFHFGRYRYRTGVDIAKEIITISEKFNIHNFQFTDSLVNGSLKTFREFLQILSEYNNKTSGKKIRWSGQYICRPNAPKDLYKLISESGGHGLTIGAESGSNRVLGFMNKKTTVEDLYIELEEFRKNNITCVLLTFVGHWSETWQDFLDHCKMFVNITPYVRSGTVSSVQLGYPMVMLHGTPSMDNAEKNKIHMADFAPAFIWKTELNPENTFKERVNRRIILTNLLKKLKIPTISNLETFSMLINLIDRYDQEIKEFYQ